MAEIILGIDPGSRITGYGVIKAQGSILTYLGSGCINVGNGVLYKRLQSIFTAVSAIVEQFSPDVLAIEETFLSKNVQSTVKLSEARAAAMVAASNSGLEVFEYTPRQIKQAVVGYGAAQKQQVQYMVKHILNLSGTPQSDAADALACAICHGYTSKITKAVQASVPVGTFGHGRYQN